MAFKFAFIAALCIAQAFAFLPFEDEEIVTDYDVIVNCWGNQRENIEVMGMKMTGVPVEVLEYLQGDMRELARKYIEELEGPVAKINETTFELHNNLLNNLRDKKVIEAAQTLMANINDIRGIYKSIHERMQQIVEEAPELNDTMEWMYRYLAFVMKLFYNPIRKSFGQCLMEGVTNDDYVYKRNY